jgi:ATP-dependent DNA ligase
MARVGFIEPMECLAADKLPEGPGWLDEIKLDGYRMIVVRNDKPELYSRLKNSNTRRSLRSRRRLLPFPMAL